MSAVAVKRPIESNYAFSNTSSTTGGFKVGPSRILAGLERSTAIAVFSNTGLTTGTSGVPFYCERSEATQIYKFGFSANSTSQVSFVFRNSASQLIENVSSVPLSASVSLHVAAFITNGAASRTIWCDGSSLTNTTNYSNSFTTANDVRIAADGFDTSSGNTSGVYYVALYDRVVADFELLELLRNPWQIFKPRNQVLYFDVPTGYSIPTLSAAMATSITATSAVPQVTLTFA